MNLPDEIKLLVAKVADNTALTACRQVCKSWLVALTPLCFQRLKIFQNLIYINTTQLSYLQNILRYVPDEAISLSFHNGRFLNGLPLLGDINLQKLELNYCQLPMDYLELLAQCKCLTSLKVTVSNKSSLAENLEPMENLSKLQNLRHLELVGFNVYDELAHHVFAPLAKLPNLETLPISISNEEQMDIIYNSPLKFGLKAIYLQGSNVSHNVIRKLAEMSNLTKLRIESAEFDDSSFSLLGTLCNLRHVCLEFLDQVTDHGFATMKKWTQLERCRFKLNGNYSFIEDKHSIRELDISSCFLEGGLSALRKLTNLESLKIGELDGLSADDFLDVPRNSLTQLRVGTRSVQVTYLENLHIFTSLVVLNYEGNITDPF